MDHEIRDSAGSTHRDLASSIRGGFSTLHLICPQIQTRDWIGSSSQFTGHFGNTGQSFALEKSSVGYDRRYIKTFVDHGESQFRKAKKNHKNGLEGFSLDSLKRKLASNGGTRREKLPFYLGEYAGGSNHRTKTEKV